MKVHKPAHWLVEEQIRLNAYQQKELVHPVTNHKLHPF